MSATPPAAFAVTPPGDRPNSIAVFGCTGNAGRAVAYYCIKSAARKPNVNIALAGRNRAKVEKVLEGIRDELRNEGAKADDVSVEIVIADANDEQSMLALAKSTDVLVSCAGPFGRYGEAAVKACVLGGAHYLDITGEQSFIERMISDYGKQAEENGVALCPFSGYDCVPAELGLWLAGRALEAEGQGIKDLALNFRLSGAGGFPKGTLETAIDAFDGKGIYKRKPGDAWFYPKEYRGPAKSALGLLHWVLPRYQMGQFTGPNVMSAINVPVMYRAASTFGFSNNLTISDKYVAGGRPTLFNGYGLFGVQLYIVSLLMGAAALAVPPVRGFIRSRLKGYSYGGNPAAKVHVEAQGLSSNGKSSSLAKCMFPGDGGIYATGLFAASVANSLREATLPNSKHPMPLAGFHSPVAALQGCRPGLLIDNLRDLGAEIKVKVVPEGKLAHEVDATKLRSKL